MERRRESAATFHARPLPPEPTRAAWVCEPTGPALVLGSAQPDGVVDRAACAAARVEVVRRRSGGGAVLVKPGEPLWVDVIVPAGDPLWQDDVGRAFLWLGRAWAAALAELGVQAQAHPGPMRRTPWSDLVCFAGLGPGEVTGGAGAKVVGISQRRTRAAARFQCAALGIWEPTEVLSLLDLPRDARTRGAVELAGAATGTGLDHDALCDSLLRHLPA